MGPILIVERLQRDAAQAGQVNAAVRIGGHRVDVVLDFSRKQMGLVNYVQIPSLLALHDPSLQAVVAAVTRFEAGENLAMPYDLSGQIKATDPPRPWFLATDDGAIGGPDHDVAEVTLIALDYDSPPSRRVRAKLQVDGRPVAIDAEVYVAERAEPVVRYAGPSETAQLSEPQLRAVGALLVQHATERSNSA